MRSILHALAAAALFPATLVPVTLLATSPQPARAEASPLACQAPPALGQLGASLETLRARRSQGGPVTIVALGTAATEGHGAQAAMGSYPAVLREELARLWPGVEVRVHAKSAAGPRAADQLANLMGEVEALAPDLVIWQPGAAEAAHDVGETRLKRYLDRGFARLAEIDADLIVMDLQFVRRRDGDPRYQGYLALIRQSARKEEAGLFQRYEIMRWVADNPALQGAGATTLDLWNTNKAANRCVALVLAQAIDQAAKAKALR